jgi:hypothetical protein
MPARRALHAAAANDPTPAAPPSAPRPKRGARPPKMVKVAGASQPQTELQAVVDGKVVEIRGAERIEIRCGKASLILTKEGKILLQGTYISSQSSGVHRVRGGSVEIN